MLHLKFFDVDPVHERTPVTFPRLHTHNIDCGETDGKPPILPSLVTPSLLFHAYRTHHPIPDTSLPAFPHFLSANRQLRQLSFGTHQNYDGDVEIWPHPPSLLKSATRFLQAADLPTDMLEDQEGFYPFHRHADLSHDETEIELLGDALDRVLDFGKNEVARMVGEKDVARQ